jgi:hypothetical protein
MKTKRRATLRLNHILGVIKHLPKNHDPNVPLNYHDAAHHSDPDWSAAIASCDTDADAPLPTSATAQLHD